MEQFTKHVERQKNGQQLSPTISNDQLSTLWTLLPSMHGRLGAPFGGEAAHGPVDLLIEAEKVADDTAVEEGSVRVGVGEVGGHQILVAELVEDHFGHEQLFIGEAAEVKHGERIRRRNRNSSSAGCLTIGMPPET